MSEYEQLKQAWNEFIDALAKEWHLYDLLDWLSDKLRRWFE